jgi:hypothetical protein
VATYEYSGTYYDVYYLFVTDTDTGTGTDASSPVTVLGSDASNAASEASSIVAHLSDTDTGTGTDAATIKISSADTGSGAENATQAIKLSSSDASNAAVDASTTHISSSDTGAGAENATQAIRLSDTDAGTGTENQSVNTGPTAVSDTDTGSGADAVVQVSPVGADTGSWAENATQAIRIHEPDVGLFTDQAQAYLISLHDTDASNPVSETTGYLPAIPIHDTDAGSGADAGQAFPDIADTDAGTGAEASSIVVHLSDADAGTGTDAGIPEEQHNDSDAGTGTEGAFISVSSADTGSGSDSTAPRLVVIDPGDSGVATENAGFPNNKIDADAGTGAETSFITAHLSDADAGGLAFETQFAIPASQLYGNPESFSIYHVGVITGITETAQLYAVQDAKITTSWTEYPCNGDDITQLIWTDLEVVTLDVQGGFLPWAAITSIMGWPVYSSGSQYSLATGLTSMPSGTQVSIGLRTYGRDILGRRRTVDIILYAVQFQTITWGGEYKNGMGASYTAFAVGSYFDEGGNGLLTREVGRLVDSPGVLAASFTGVYGKGT